MERYEELANKLRNAITPDDIIGAMLCELKDKEGLPIDPGKIHGAVQKLKERFPDLLEEFVFFKGDAYPFSNLLERVLFRLESSHILSTLNPYYEKYGRINCDDELRERFRVRFGDQYERIKEMAAEFEKIIKDMDNKAGVLSNGNNNRCDSRVCE